ncbi:peptide chain release factor N(5)-glutamine methyltransferase [Lentibacillus sediminis]|uniref:peptide chain release factor N(5)-glutamine methyltransferase n=1 Tax=Lentibacillus sediminis TaxID=1940529 RepID=UPI000C1BB27C|nr:peptide chain release factor N(5)-glutamine methyltransferase [Lentibacillus sediminis]
MPRKQYEVLQWASSFLEKQNREARVAEILLMHYLQVSRAEFFANIREPVAREIDEAFQEDIRLHAEIGIPVQHLTGYEMFYGRKFTVNEHVLIPRPETEELVEHVLTHACHMRPCRIVDVGTGSGVIAVTLALELPEATVYAMDISAEALEVAAANAERLGANVTFLQGDFLQPLIDEQIHPDIIVSNPPYISREEEADLSVTVKNFDPELALFAEENGLAAYRKIIRQSADLLQPGSRMALEIGYQQGDAVKDLVAEAYPVSITEIIKDINGKDRIVSAVIN